VDPTPKEEDVVFQTTLPLLLNTYIPYSPPRFNESLDIPIIYTMTIPHQPKQVKSMWYYVFWSVATVSVVLGQIYVASGYKELASALSKLLWSIA